MADTPMPPQTDEPASDTAVEQRPAGVTPRQLPPYRLLLHNDDVNVMDDVVRAIVQLTPLDAVQAKVRMLEAHRTGTALLLTTHRERGELYVEQFATFLITTSLER